MSPHSEDDVEIVDSGHMVATRNPDADIPEFWALVENEARPKRITVELELRNEAGVLARHERTHTVGSPSRQRYRFTVRPPAMFDQYVFNIVAYESPATEV